MSKTDSAKSSELSSILKEFRMPGYLHSGNVGRIWHGVGGSTLSISEACRGIVSEPAGGEDKAQLGGCGKQPRGLPPPPIGKPARRHHADGHKRAPRGGGGGGGGGRGEVGVVGENGVVGKTGKQLQLSSARLM